MTPSDKRRETPTPKQTVEAMRKEIEAIVRQLYLSGDHFDEEDVAVKDGTDKIMALLNPVESQGTQKRGAWNKPLEQFPSPNEAPKGEAAFFYPTKKEVKGLVRFANDLHEKAQPPATDKEWEKEELTGEEALFIGWILSEFYTKGNKTSIKTVAFDALRHAYKHHKIISNRRIEEVIGEIETIIVTEAQNRNVGIGTSVFAFYYAIRSEIEALKKKLSLSHKEKEK